MCKGIASVQVNECGIMYLNLVYIYEKCNNNTFIEMGIFRRILPSWPESTRIQTFVLFPSSNQQQFYRAYLRISICGGMRQRQTAHILLPALLCFTKQCRSHSSRTVLITLRPLIKVAHRPILLPSFLCCRIDICQSNTQHRHRNLCLQSLSSN